MPADFGIVYPLWNHADDGESLLERAHGEIGLDHVTVPVITGPRTQFSLFSGRPTPYFHTEGGWHFPVQASRYAATGLSPRAARWFGKRDPLARVREIAERLGLRFIARINPLHAPRIADQAEATLCRDAWGDVYDAAIPCISNPAARDLIEACFDDLARYRPHGVELMGVHLDFMAIDLDLFFQIMELKSAMEICFCAACRQLGSQSVDVEAAARSVRALTELSFREGGLTDTFDKLGFAIMGDAVIEDYRRARAGSLHRWLTMLAARHPSLSAYLEAGPACSSEVEPGSLPGWTPLGTADDGSGPCPDGAEPCSEDAAPDESSPPPPAIFHDLQMRESPDELVRFVRAAVREGVRFIDFENLEALPPERIDAVKQAVRFARRDSAD